MTLSRNCCLILHLASLGYLMLSGLAQETNRIFAIDLPTALRLANAQVQESLQRYDLAQQEYRKAIELDPKEPEAHFDLAEILREKSQMAEAAAEYQKAFAFGLNHPVAHYNAACAAAFDAFWNTGMVIGSVLMAKSHPDGSGATVSRIVTWCPIKEELVAFTLNA